MYHSCMRIDHVAVAVKDLDSAVELFTKVFGGEVTWRGRVEEQGVEVVRITVNGVDWELLGGIGEDSPVTKFIERRGEGLHHVSFRVDDIESEVERLKSLGLKPVSEKPTKGSKNSLIFFFHPKSLRGVLLELCQHPE